MQILLKCKNVSGSVAFSEEMIDGAPVGERHYSINNHLVALDGYRDEVLHHDADELLGQANGLFRMLTPAEQDALAEQQRAASTAQESVPADSAVSQSAQEASTEQQSADGPEQQPTADSQPPALLEKIKKVSSGG